MHILSRIHCLECTHAFLPSTCVHWHPERTHRCLPCMGEPNRAIPIMVHTCPNCHGPATYALPNQAGCDAIMEYVERIPLFESRDEINMCRQFAQWLSDQHFWTPDKYTIEAVLNVLVHIHDPAEFIPFLEFMWNTVDDESSGLSEKIDACESDIRKSSTSP